MASANVAVLDSFNRFVAHRNRGYVRGGFASHGAGLAFARQDAVLVP